VDLLAIDVGNTRVHAALFRDGRFLHVVDRFPKADAVAAATVRPFRLPRGTLLLSRDFSPLVRNRARHPETVGADRLAAASAAWADSRRACAAVTIGTAVTLSVVNARGEFVGGLIAPGPALQSRALHEHTALLPLVTPRRARSVIGRETRDAVVAGVFFSVSGLLREARRELGRVPIYGSGGDGALFRDLFDEWRPHLVLEGIDVSYRSASHA
jgi:type III pantothenate kinase